MKHKKNIRTYLVRFVSPGRCVHTTAVADLEKRNRTRETTSLHFTRNRQHDRSISLWFSCDLVFFFCPNFHMCQIWREKHPTRHSPVFNVLFVYCWPSSPSEHNSNNNRNCRSVVPTACRPSFPPGSRPFVMLYLLPPCFIKPTQPTTAKMIHRSVAPAACR